MSARSSRLAATDAPPASRPHWFLKEVDQGVAAAIPAGSSLIAGRGGAVDLTLRDPGVSRRHFEIQGRDDRLELRDLGSKGGTFVNGKDVQRAVITAGDVIEAGSSRLVALQLQPLVPAIEGGSLEVVHYQNGEVVTRRALAGPLLVGRMSECDIVIDHPRVSRRHLEIHPNGSTATVKDLAPNNRVEVNGRAFQGTRGVSPGDRIALGGADQVLVVESPDSYHGPVAIEVTVDGSPQSRAVEVDAGTASTVREVAAELAAFMGAEDGEWTLLQPERGSVLHPANRWVDAGVKRGDRLTLVEIPDVPDGPVEAVRYGSARVALNQLPRSVTPPERHKVRTPRPPETQSLRGRGVTWQILGGAGIILAGLIIALVRPAYAWFALVGGLVGIISIGAGIMGEQSRRKHGVRQFRQRLADLDGELQQVRRHQTGRLLEVNPSPARALEWVAARDRRLWERRPGDPDFLRLRLGIGQRRALIDAEDNTVHSESPFASELTDLLDRHVFLQDVPILTPPSDKAPIVGLVGNRPDVLEVASWLVIQASVLHAPAELEVAIPAVNQDWLWARWLPHLERPDAIDITWNEAEAAQLARRLRSERRAERTDRSQGPARLVVVPHGSSEVMAEALADGTAPDTVYLVLADRTSDLPSRVDAVVSIEGDVAHLEGPSDDGPMGAIQVDRLDHETASRAARLMGRYVDGRRPPRQTSSQLGLLDLLGVAGTERLDVATLWSSPPASPLSAVVGTTLDDEPLLLGFRSDGVHGVVGGTTGSGKSEFLQTLLASLALTHRPDQLSFFLIDYKGGATFAALADLPHVAGVVTDLEKDATLANRAFTSLEAEMARRKQMLDEARVPGIVEYERLPEASTRPLPALLVVIDEFALLVRQQPEVKERLDLVATQGRSLGVHLLLATQSPSNVITPSIRSNTQVWISLRVVDDSESVELLGQRDAARIPPDRPGRGFVRFGGSQSITGFQTARIARPLADEAVRPAVSVVPFADVAPTTPAAPYRKAPPPSGRVVTELEAVCRTVAAQSRRLGAAAASPLWLDPLPEELPAPTSYDGLVREAGHLRALVGLVDDPARHVQKPWSIDLGQLGNVLVVGMRGSGKSATLRQIVVDLAEQLSPEDLHLYGVESGTGSLNPLSRLPHSAAVVPVADKERLYRSFGRLVRLMEERRERLAASGQGDFTSWRRTSALPEPWIILALDDYPAFKEVADGSGLGLLNDQLLSLCQGGPSVGIHVVVSCSQSSDMRMNLVNLFGSRILLRQVDAADYALLDLRLRPNELPPFLPGRALVEGGYEMHVYHSDDSRLDEVSETWSDVERGPDPILRLPTEISLDDLAEPPAQPVIGVGGPEHLPIALDFDRSEPHFVIAAEGRTGRSTTLLTVFQAISRFDPSTQFTILAPRPSPLRDLAGTPTTLVATSPSEMAEAVRHLAEDPALGRVLLIDDAESLPGEVGDLLERLLRDAGQLGLRSFVAGRSTDLSRSFDSWIRYLLSLRTGLLLMPAPDGGFVFDVRLPSGHVAMTPGRGFLCERGEIRFIQVALPSIQPAGKRRDR